MKKMHGFIGMSVRVCAFVVALVFTSVALTGCEYLDQVLGGIGLGGGVEPGDGGEPGETGHQPGQPEEPTGVQPGGSELTPVPEPAGPMAEGGELTFIKVDDAWYEVHTFRTVETTELSFDRTPAGGTVEVLVVGGGGAGGSTVSGGNGREAGGGGAGRFVYVESYPIGTGPITVTVGAGGTAYSSGAGGTGGNGGASHFGGITAPGGGGGGRHWHTVTSGGQAGGSGGGGPYSYEGSAVPGTVPPDSTGQILNLGHDGGTGSGAGTGGGGAGAVGGAGGQLGGIGAQSSISGEEQWYAGGGTGGGGVQPSSYPAEAYGGYYSAGDAGTWHGAANTGDGGSGSARSANIPKTGGNGGSGIVIVRWPYVALAP